MPVFKPWALSVAVGLALTLLGPWTAAGQEPAATPPPPATGDTAAGEAAAISPSPGADAAKDPQAAPAPDHAIAQAPPVDPLLAEVRRRLSGEKPGGRRNRDDLTALAEFYAAPGRGLLWVDGAGLTPKAKAAMAEIGTVRDWGLEAGDFDLPPSELTQASATERAEAEVKLSLAVLKYVHQARGGRAVPSRISPLIDQRPELKEPRDVLAEIGAAEDVARYLRDHHPPHPQFEKLRQALLHLRREQEKGEEDKAPADKVRLPDGPLLRLGSEHPDVALLRQRLGVAAEPGLEERFDEAVERAVLDFQRAQGLGSDGVVGRGTRAVLNGDSPHRASLASARAEQRLIVNMERWRWMPRDLGQFHVINNIPEFQTRVFKDGTEIFSERIIVGKTDTRTPVFSADMKYVIFHPSWGVPSGIKENEILPYLQVKTGLFGLGGSDTRILERHNLFVTYRGQPVDASKVNWSSANVHDYDFIQPPGPTNVLGRVKFRFPNRHDVYMHDTPERELFANSFRAFSHGCIRVRNPLRLAEILLREDKGWSAEEVGRRWSGAAGGDIELERKIPVHTAYFTATVSAAGEVQYFPDLYGYDGRTARAIGGDARAFDGESIPQQGPPPSRRAPQVANKGGGTVADLISGFLSN